MGQLFNPKPERKWTDPTTRPGYVSPFGKKNPELRRKSKKSLNEYLARELKKRHPEWKQSVKEITAELDYQEFLRENKK